MCSTTAFTATTLTMETSKSCGANHNVCSTFLYIGDGVSATKKIFMDGKHFGQLITSARIILAKKSQVLNNSLTSNAQSLQENPTPRSWSIAQSIQQDLSLSFPPKDFSLSLICS